FSFESPSSGIMAFFKAIILPFSDSNIGNSTKFLLHSVCIFEYQFSENSSQVDFSSGLLVNAQICLFTALLLINQCVNSCAIVMALSIDLLFAIASLLSSECNTILSLSSVGLKVWPFKIYGKWNFSDPIKGKSLNKFGC